MEAATRPELETCCSEAVLSVPGEPQSSRHSLRTPTGTPKQRLFIYEYFLELRVHTGSGFIRNGHATVTEFPASSADPGARSMLGLSSPGSWPGCNLVSSPVCCNSCITSCWPCPLAACVSLLLCTSAFFLQTVFSFKILPYFFYICDFQVINLYSKYLPISSSFSSLLL